MSLEEEVRQLRSEIVAMDQWIGCQDVVQSGNQNWCHENFESVLHSYVATRRIAKQYGLEIPSAEFRGMTELEILTACLAQREKIETLRHVLSQKVGVLGAEMRVKIVLSHQTDDLGEDSDFLVLRSEDRAKIIDLIAKIRFEVTDASWMDDRHRARVLKKISGVEEEVLQPLSLYRRTLGDILDLGDTIGEFGNRSKPAFDRVTELLDSIRGAKRQNAQLSKDKDPLQIPDLRTNEPKL